MSEPLCLTDLDETGAGVRRVSHGYATSGSWPRLAKRLVLVGSEVALALPRDVWRLTVGRGSKLIRIDDGIDPSPNATRIAVYVHYSANGQISDMVRYQLGLVRQAGFATVFISM